MIFYLRPLFQEHNSGIKQDRHIQGGSNMTGTDLCVNKPQSVPVIFEPPCIISAIYNVVKQHRIMLCDF